MNNINTYICRTAGATVFKATTLDYSYISL